MVCEIGERGWGAFLPVPESLPSIGGDDDGLDRTGADMPLPVRPAVVRPQVVVRMLDGRHFQAALVEQRDETFDERGLEGVFPADDADELGELSHACSRWRTAHAPSPDPPER